MTIPPPAGGTPPSAPTGQVFSGDNPNFAPAAFIFATEDGTISTWNPANGTNAVLKFPASGAASAIYKGLAIGGDHLYAANFKTGTIDVFDSNFNPVTLSGAFNDPAVPANFAPFNIQRLNNQGVDELFVTYALPDANHKDDVPGLGNGYVSVFDLNGNLKRHLVSDSVLNSPWGLAIAPAGFGAFGDDLLVGNFGDGTIHAFDASTGQFLGSLEDATGSSIVNLGLWGLKFGTGSQGFDPNTLYFTAGIPGPDQIEDHGLFGSLQVVPEPGSLALMSGVLAVWLPWRRSNRTRRP